jgi:hypothetical protein
MQYYSPTSNEPSGPSSSPIHPTVLHTGLNFDAVEQTTGEVEHGDQESENSS